MTHSLTLALVLAAAYIRGQMEYRFNFVVLVVMRLVYQLTGFVFVWVLIARFNKPGRVDARRDRVPVRPAAAGPRAARDLLWQRRP